ncbi:MAG: DUF1800 family protein [Candidatus Thiothrix singaporensis]|uniref:DUF1800 family protein n=1 Tax=Candidatus Thiothrix singaporensis TaxID=2799669 RepID=A0A7L6AXK2_9GAMM|nr:MAG: DUF1800 family protein [Candidatus Thiothrix singaporensis]
MRPTPTVSGQKRRAGWRTGAGCFAGAPRTAEHIAEKCWYAFVSTDSPDQAQTRQWANAFRSSGYDIKTLLEGVLLSEAFWAPQHRGMLVKSPLDLLTGVFRALPWPGVAPSELVKYAEKLGQNPFVPPTPKGWEGGKAWITTQSLLTVTAFCSN